MLLGSRPAVTALPRGPPSVWKGVAGLTTAWTCVPRIALNPSFRVTITHPSGLSTGAGHVPAVAPPCTVPLHLRQCPGPCQPRVHGHGPLCSRDGPEERMAGISAPSLPAAPAGPAGAVSSIPTRGSGRGPQLGNQIRRGKWRPGEGGAEVVCRADPWGRARWLQKAHSVSAHAHAVSAAKGANFSCMRFEPGTREGFCTPERTTREPGSMVLQLGLR